MNKSDFRGFKQVFLFEFMTGIKKSSFKVFLIIMCALAFFTTPILVIVGNIKGEQNAKENAAEKTEIESIYVYDDTSLAIDYKLFNKKDKYSDVSFITDGKLSYDDAVKELTKESEKNNIVIKTEYDSEVGFDVTIAHSKKSDVKSAAIDGFKEEYLSFYREEILKNLEVSEKDYEYLSKDFNVTVMKAAEDGSLSEDAEGISLSEYIIMLVGLMIVLMFINLSAGNVASSVATEKSSRVIEYLMVGTRPMALLAGKIVARVLETVITTLSAYSCYFMSQLFCTFLVSDNMAASTSSSNVVVVSSVWETITVSKIIVAVIYFLAGVILFTIIGALTGASVSKLDELQDAMKFYSFLMLLCSYADMFLVIMMLTTGEVGIFQDFCAICPLTGAFLTPALILTGKIGILEGLIALIVMIITVVVTYILSATVYESMLLFQGNRLKFKDIVTLMKKQVVE
ncbi:ABC transporter permease [Butyrivibrio sp. YAB3001]|uniref:ABC transporter permease n=1 Tax=Butyrivibrio sp. YAB3001 TaxID=1520812 RepID=UPI0008F6759C|nr:ABC transporter permease [Butyrivibrio sp. YAB3001]SFD03901.1 ABC-2 type transport system permease protein [Butyrivibrio sp. YAB3001]